MMGFCMVLSSGVLGKKKVCGGGGASAEKKKRRGKEKSLEAK